MAENYGILSDLSKIWDDSEEGRKKVSAHIDNLMSRQTMKRKRQIEEWLLTKSSLYLPRQNASYTRIRDEGKITVRDDFAYDEEGNKAGIQYGLGLLKGTFISWVSEEMEASPEPEPIFPEGMDEAARDKALAEFKLMLAGYKERVEFEDLVWTCISGQHLYGKMYAWSVVDKGGGDKRYALFNEEGKKKFNVNRNEDGSWVNPVTGQEVWRKPVPELSGVRGKVLKALDAAKGLFGLGADLALNDQPAYEERTYLEHNVTGKALFPYQVWMSTGAKTIYDAHEVVIEEDLDRWEVKQKFPKAVLWGKEYGIDWSKIKPAGGDTQAVKFTVFGDKVSSDAGMDEPVYKLHTLIRLRDSEFPKGFCAMRLGGEGGILVWAGDWPFEDFGLAEFADVKIVDEADAIGGLSFLAPHNRLINTVIQAVTNQAESSGKALQEEVDESGNSRLLDQPTFAHREHLRYKRGDQGQGSPLSSIDYGGMEAELLNFLKLLQMLYDLESGRWDISPGIRTGDQKTATQTGWMREKEQKYRKGIYRNNARAILKHLNQWRDRVTNPEVISEWRREELTEGNTSKEFWWNAKTLSAVRAIRFVPGTEEPRTMTQKRQSALIMLQNAPTDMTKLWAYSELGKVAGQEVPEKMVKPPELPPAPLGAGEQDALMAALQARAGEQPPGQVEEFPTEHPLMTE